MSPHDKTAPGQTDAITFEWELRHPPARVWRSLTEPELLKDWLLPVVGFSLEPGAAFTFQTDPYPGQSNWDGRVNCRMVEVEVGRRISYTWGVPGMDTVVTFTLTPTATGTLLSLVQTGFRPEQKQNFGGARYGWNLMGGKLIEQLARTA